jgi:hypothetical protein
MDETHGLTVKWTHVAISCQVQAGPVVAALELDPSPSARAMELSLPQAC